MTRVHNSVLIPLLLSVRCGLCELRCDLSSMDIKTLECVALGTAKNYITSNARDAEYNKAFRPISDVHDMYSFDWTKPEWRKVNTVILKDARIKILDKDVFASTSVINLDVSGNQNIKLQTERSTTALKDMRTIRLSGMNLSIPSREKLPDQEVDTMTPSGEVRKTVDKYKPLSIDDLQNFPFLEILDLSSNALIDLTKFKVGKLLSSLNVSHTRVTLGDGCFEGAAELKVLVMTHCRIGAIPEGAFRGAGLSHLDVSNNDLTEASLRSLTEGMTFVNLSHNCISDTSYTFTSSLETLDLSYNRISQLNRNTFSATKNLYLLNLSHNRLSSLDSALFEELQNLRTLDLSYNVLTRLNHLNIKNLNKLETLDLSGNQFQRLDRNLFEGKPALKVLLLRHNKLNSLRLSTFSRLDGLRVLDLSDNYLKSLPDELLYTLNLETFSASCNWLSYLPDNFFEWNRDFENNFNKIAYLYGNPWNCECLSQIINATKFHDKSTDYEHVLHFSDGSRPSCYVGSKVGGLTTCDSDALSSDDYARWETALSTSGIKCLPRRN